MKPGLVSLALAVGVLAACGGSDPIALGRRPAEPTAIATTAPLAFADPPASDPAVDPVAPAKSALEPAATSTPPRTSPTQVPVPADPAPTAAIAPPADTNPTATTVPPADPEPTAAPPAEPSGARIALVDIEVVDLLAGTEANLADLSPNGPTLLFFWAPH